MFALCSMANPGDMRVLPAEESHAVIADVLIGFSWNLVGSLACSEDGLIPDSTNTDIENLAAVRCTSFNHFDLL